MPALQDAVIVAVLVFCRVGGCLMFAPGFSSSRIPMQIRLFIAIAISLAVVPMLLALFASSLLPLTDARFFQLVLTESLTGVLLGLMGRCFLLATQFAATFIANVIGLAGIPGIPLEDAEGSTPLTSLLSMSTTMLLLASGAHIEMLRAVIDSYSAIPPRPTLEWDWLARNLTSALAETSLLALRLAAPFALYSILVNLAIGLAGKFTPQLQIYFIATGATLIGGLFILMLVAPDWLGLAAGAYWSWLREGSLE